MYRIHRSRLNSSCDVQVAAKLQSVIKICEVCWLCSKLQAPELQIP